jgi:hypothetical protein
MENRGPDAGNNINHLKAEWTEVGEDKSNTQIIIEEHEKQQRPISLIKFAVVKDTFVAKAVA